MSNSWLEQKKTAATKKTKPVCLENSNHYQMFYNKVDFN